MSSEAAINAIELVKNKLEKYIRLGQDDKVDEYLSKLQHTLITPEILQKTKIDVCIKQLLSNDKPYNSKAKNLLKKWHNIEHPTKTTNPSKVKTITNTNKPIVEKKLPNKRKSNDDDHRSNSNRLSESNSSDEYKTDEKNQPPVVKKRKVVSYAEYVGNKKPTTTTTTATTEIDSTVNKLTDNEIEEIYAQFNANCQELAASAPDLATDVNKKLAQNNTTNGNRNGFVANNSNIKLSAPAEQYKMKHDELWEEEDDDDDDDVDNMKSNNQYKQQPQPTKNERTVDKNNSNVKQIKTSKPTALKKSEDLSMKTAIASNNTSTERLQLPIRSSNIQSADTQQQSNNYNYFRPKKERQAIYSGRRTHRTDIPSLQNLCIETLKENIADICQSHFGRLPYELVKPIIDVATPDQLYEIIYNNPDYADDVEPLWQHFCALRYKDAQLEENESYYELYLRKTNEYEERLQKLTQRAKQKKAETVDTGRQTKSLNIGQTTNRHINNSTKSTREVVHLPPTKSQRAQAKVKKPTIPPLLKQTLKFFNARN